MAKNPSTRWFFNDWRLDAELMSCSDAAQGLWAWLLCFCAENGGYLLIGGKKPSVRELARLRGRDPRKVSAQVKELETKGVFSRTEDGVIYNRRMVREVDQGVRQVGAKLAKSAAHPRPANQPDLFDNSKKTRARAGDSGSRPQDSTCLDKLETHDAAREKKKNEKGNPLARCAGLVRADARPVKTPALRAKIKQQLVGKCARFLAATGPPEAVAAYWAAQLDDDPSVGQRALDTVDRRMRRCGWDDMRQWKRHAGIAS